MVISPMVTSRRTQAIGFITEWTVAGDATARTIELPVANFAAVNCNAVVDWGDGTGTGTITGSGAGKTHTYSSNGTYQVTITGLIPTWSMGLLSTAGNRAKCTNIIYWGDKPLFAGFYDLLEGFRSCTNLTSTGTGTIPWHADAIGTYLTYERLFEQTPITSIHSGIFGEAATENTGFYETFYNCTSLTTVPSGLFDNQTNSAVGYAWVFQNCTSLATIPDLIFRNTAGTVFEGAFYTCNKLQLNTKIFANTGEGTTRFLNLSPVFSDLIYRTSWTGTQGTAPDLWDYSYGTGTPNITAPPFDGAGNSTTSISNYNDIPAAWK